MRTCAHVSLTESFRERIINIKSLVVNYAREQIGLYCNECQNKEELFISYGCGTVLCGSHMGAACESGDEHKIFFNIDKDTVYCRICDLNFKISDSELYKQLRNKEMQTATRSCISLKKFTDLGQTSYISVLLQIILNYGLIREHFFSFHHSLFECSIASCPDCFFKKIYSQIYSSNPVDLSEAVYFIYKRTRHHVPFKIKNVKHAFRLLCNAYHPDASAPKDCQCILHKVFFGEQDLEQKCTVCKSTSVCVEQFIMMEFEPHYNLSVAVDEHLSTSVSSAFSYCKACLNTAPTYQKRIITKFPRLLCIYFSRFRGEVENKKNKLKIFIDKRLNVQGKIYSLYAFIEHKGGTYGYYICYILFNGEWYEFNRDQIMNNVSVNLKASNATMLFYTLE